MSTILFLESFETHFDLVANKIEAKLNFSSNHCHLWWYCNCGQFVKNCEYEIDYFWKKKKKIGKLFLQVSEHCASFWTKTQFGHFWEETGGVCMSLLKKNPKYFVICKNQFFGEKWKFVGFLVTEKQQQFIVQKAYKF